MKPNHVLVLHAYVWIKRSSKLFSFICIIASHSNLQSFIWTFTIHSTANRHTRRSIDDFLCYTMMSEDPYHCTYSPIDSTPHLSLHNWKSNWLKVITSTIVCHKRRTVWLINDICMVIKRYVSLPHTSVHPWKMCSTLICSKIIFV